MTVGDCVDDNVGVFICYLVFTSSSFTPSSPPECSLFASPYPPPGLTIKSQDNFLVIGFEASTTSLMVVRDRVRVAF